MNNYIRNGLVALVMLVQAAFSSDPAVRLTELKSEISNKTVNFEFRQQHDSSEVSVRVDKDGFGANGKLQLEHPLGQGSAFGEYREDNPDENNKEQTFIAKGGHTILDFKPVRNQLCLTYKKQSSESSETWKDTLSSPSASSYKDNTENKETDLSVRGIQLDNRLFGLFGFNFERTRIEEKGLTKDLKHILTEYTGFDSLFESANLATIETENIADLTKFGGSVSHKNFSVSFDNTQIKQTTELSKIDSTNAIDGNQYQYYITDERDLEGYIRTLELMFNYGFVRNISFLGSIGRKKGEIDLFNDYWLPRDASARSKLESIMGNIHIILGKNVLNELDVDYSTYLYDAKADTGVMGLNPQGPHEDVKTVRCSYALSIPFSRWDSDGLFGAKRFRHTGTRKEEERSKVLRLPIPIQTHHCLSSYERTNFSLSFEREESNPIDEHHETNTGKIGVLHYFLRKGKLKLGVSYDSDHSRTNSSYKDTSSTEPTRSSSNKYIIGIPGIINDKFMFRLTIGSNNSNPIYGLSGQLIIRKMFE